MKTPEEIKKGLNHCSEDGCKQCPYKDDCDMADGFSVLAGDANAYIQQLENHICELTEKVEQLEAEQTKWISVEDRLPIDCTDVLVFIRIGCTSSTSISNVLKRRWWSRGIPIENVTHWMPLPSTEGLE